MAKLTVEITRRDWCAPLETLRRRSCLRVLPLPLNRYLIVGWMSL